MTVDVAKKSMAAGARRLTLGRIAHADSEPRLSRIVPIYLCVVALSENPAIDVMGLNLTPIRLLLLLLFVPAMIALTKKRDVRFQAFDVLVVLVGFWIVIALSVNNGINRGISYGGSLTLESWGGYLIARAYVRSPAQLISAAKFYMVLVAILGVLAIPEAVLHQKLFDLSTGAPSADPFAAPAEDNNYVRFGLLRASVTFDHPILFGAYCATSFGMAWYVFKRPVTRLMWMGIIAVSSFLSVSSAALLACAFATGCIVWERSTRWLPHRTAITLASIGTVLLILQLLANRSLAAVILPLVSLNQWTAYYRLLIWEFASENIANNKMFGIGLNDWIRPNWMPPSVDSFWLATALTSGLPAIAFLTAATLLLLRRVHTRVIGEKEERRRARYAWTVALLALSMQGFTVHYWGAMNSFFFFILGLGAWMSDSRNGLAIEAISEPRTKRALMPERTTPRRGSPKPQQPLRHLDR